MLSASEFDLLIKNLQSQLTLKLPGKDAQMLMAPKHRFSFPENSEEAKLSSVLILLYPDEETIKIVLIKRATYNGYHSGQISFPGGKYEKNDQSLIATALRETKEEIGVDSDSVHILGTISSLFIPISNIMVLPVVGVMNHKPEFIPDTNEVSKIIEVDINELMKPGIVMQGTIETEVRIIEFPYYPINEHHVWGATAMILSEFLAIVSRIDAYRLN